MFYSHHSGDTETAAWACVWIPKLVRGLFSLQIYTVQHVNVGAFSSLRLPECSLWGHCNLFSWCCIESLLITCRQWSSQHGARGQSPGAEYPLLCQKNHMENMKQLNFSLQNFVKTLLNCCSVIYSFSPTFAFWQL